MALFCHEQNFIRHQLIFFGLWLNLPCRLEEYSAEMDGVARYKSPLLTSNGKDVKAVQSCTDGSFVSERRSGNKVLRTAFGRTFCLQINRSGACGIRYCRKAVCKASALVPPWGCPARAWWCTRWMRHNEHRALPTLVLFHGSSPGLILSCSAIFFLHGHLSLAGFKTYSTRGFNTNQAPLDAPVLSKAFLTHNQTTKLPAH